MVLVAWPLGAEKVLKPNTLNKSNSFGCGRSSFSWSGQFCPEERHTARGIGSETRGRLRHIFYPLLSEFFCRSSGSPPAAFFWSSTRAWKFSPVPTTCWWQSRIGAVLLVLACKPRDICIPTSLRAHFIMRASPMLTRKMDTASVHGPGDQTTDTDAGVSHPKLAAYLRLHFKRSLTKLIKFNANSNTTDDIHLN